mgnify:CR=1 FL=1
MAGNNTIEFTEQNFADEVLNSQQPVLVDFWATWCPPCKIIAPVVDEVADATQGTAKVGKVNVEDHPSLAEKYGVRAIPTLIVFKGGEEADRVTGAGTDKDTLVSKLQA